MEKFTFSGCDLLSFYYLCRTGNNIITERKWKYMVVICFHFTIFVVLETTSVNHISGAGMLWFAFILLSLSYWKQLVLQGVVVGVCCDLLSFYYLCRTGNNVAGTTSWRTTVVICFHFTIFVVLETTPFAPALLVNKLWFAFILLSLSYWKQRGIARHLDEYRCDLLSFYYLCRTGNNPPTFFWDYCHVVICFHFTIFVVLETT